jgi:hypothetical protein
LTPHRSIILALAVSIGVCAGASESRSQGMWVLLTYQPTIAVGDARDFVSDPGYYGFGAEWRSFRESKNLSWSLSASGQVIYGKTDELIQLGNTTISGTQVRYLDFVPLLVGLDYHFLSRKSRVRPFVAAAGGAYWVRQRVQIGTYDVIINKNWHLGLAPEIGITFLTPDLEFYGFVSSAFHYVFSRDDSIDYTYVTLKLGFVYLL